MGSYTPSKIQMNDAPFQLGVSRATENGGSGSSVGSNHANGNSHKDKKVEKAPDASEEGKKDFLRPIEDATSWSGSSSSSDMLF